MWVSPVLGSIVEHASAVCAVVEHASAVKMQVLCVHQMTADLPTVLCVHGCT
jgi:hypothetical protein